MKLQIFEYRCDPFGHEFRSPQLPLSSYGEFILRDETGSSMTYLNAMKDSTYKEVDALLQKYPDLSEKASNKRANILQRIYGAVACDPDAAGHFYKIGQQPRCPVCSSTIMNSWRDVRPAEYIELDVPLVTHMLWQSLNDDEKIDRVNGAL